MVIHLFGWGREREDNNEGNGGRERKTRKQLIR